MEAAHDFLNYRPLPYFAGVIASRALLVVAEPLHFMYPKINRFLNKAPRWDIDKLPSYWVHKILLHPPADDNAHYDEVGWLLEVLTDGLRTPEVSIFDIVFKFKLMSIQRTWRSIGDLIYLNDCFPCQRLRCEEVVSKRC